ncbi:MAG: hypothetical protein V3S89_12395 [Desulfobacterales bacterium]
MPEIIGAAFWIFIGGVVVGGMWYANARNRETQKTIRLAIEKDIALDDALLEKLLRRQSGNPDDYYISGIICLAICIGLPIMGYFIGQIAREAFFPLVGAGILVGLIGISLILCGKFMSRREKAIENGNGRM